MKQSLHIVLPADLVLIVLGRAASTLGDLAATTALVLHAHTAGWGATGVSAVMLCGSLPLALGARPAGRLVDRLDSRPLTAATATVQAVCAALIAVLTRHSDGGGVLPTIAVLALLTVIGAAQAVAGPAWSAVLPIAVRPDRLTHALALTQAAATLATVTGAGLGGALAAHAGTATALALDCATFAVLAVVALAVRARRRPGAGGGAAGAGAGERHPSAQPVEATGHLLADPRLARLVTATISLVAALHLVLVARVFLIRDALHAGATAFGLVTGAAPAGMLIGSLLAVRLPGPRSTAQADPLRTARPALLVMALGIIASGLAPGVAWLAAAQLAVGVGLGVVSVTVNAAIVDAVPAAAHGRAFASYLGAMQACDVGGTVLGGPALGLLGARGVHLAAGALGTVVVLRPTVVTTWWTTRRTPAREMAPEATDASGPSRR